MENKKDLFKNYISNTNVKISIAVTLFSILMLVISLVGIEFNNDAIGSLCMISLIIEFLYGIIITFNILKNNEKYKHLIPFLFLNWFIGCFCTNVFINIFENLPVWVYLITFLFCLSNFFIYSHFKNKYITPICYFVNGFSFLLILYFAIYLIPFAPISFVGIIALGLGFYGLAPMIVFIIHSVTLSNLLLKDKKNSNYFSIGLLSVLSGLIIFTVLLNLESEKLSQNDVTKSFEKNNEDVPTYITISQNLSPNFLNEILLKKDIVYICTDDFFSFRGFESFGSKQYNERKTHNPFINVGYLFSKKLNLSADDRINILKSNFNKRLETEEQLWSGTDLFTKNIKEDVKIYANSRLAYTEITMDIAYENKSWGQKEAIYSFQLPEGSVATSLSLWVNGVERKGVLTTKEKAQAAYKQIVAVENRDPSLLQWKEGNKVVVRIFPISYDLPRTFKCGFTTPLQVNTTEMKYQSLQITGPNISNATTISRLQIVGDSKFTTDKDFELKNGFYINEATGLDDWQAVMPLNKLVANSFIWKDKVYEIKPLEKTLVSFSATELVLDLDSNWKLNEVKSIITSTSKKCFVYVNNEKLEINANNYETILDKFETLHYSLLPLFKLEENSLVITKCGTFSANFEELETSNYLKKIKASTKQKNIKVINISENINPFWQTIKEQKYVAFISTNLQDCIKLVSKNNYISYKKAENSVSIEPANIAIQENLKSENSKSNGSNHLFRMYAFAKVLDEQVKIQSDTLANNKYVDLAKQANIVTPIYSLIVLETDKDYVENGIEKNVDTLGNASIHNDGSVPEPYEWVMIFAAMSLLFFYYKSQKKQAL